MNETGYSPDRFYTATKIGDDDAEKVQIKFPASTWARVCGVAGDTRYPSYRTPHDVVRDAITHRLHYLAEQGEITDADLIDWIRLQVRQGEVERRQAMMRAARDTVNKLMEAFGDAERERDWELADELVEQAREAEGELRNPYAGELAAATEEFELKVKRERKRK